MSKTAAYKYSYHSSFFQDKKRSEDYRPVPPRPQDLTEQKIADRMARIFVGDMIKFDSYKETYTAAQVDRHGTTIKTVAPVVEHCGGYVMVRLRNGVLESVNYFDIESVNGHSFPGYIRKESQPEVEILRSQLWS